MNTWIYFLLKFVHVTAMAVWLGGPPVAILGLRRTLGLGPGFALAAVERLIAVTPVFVAAALVTIVSGALLIFAAGGPAFVPTQILVGAGLTFPILVVGGTVVRPTLLALQAHFAAGGESASAEHLLRRFVWAHRTEQMLRVSVLALMVVRS